MVDRRDVGAQFRKGQQRRQAAAERLPGPGGAAVDVDRLLAESRQSVSTEPDATIAERGNTVEAARRVAATVEAQAAPHIDDTTKGAPATTASPSLDPRQQARQRPPGTTRLDGPNAVRSMFIPVELTRAVRVVAAMRDVTILDVVMDAARASASQVLPVESRVERRRRIHTDRLQLHLSPSQTALLDELAEERNMTRSAYISAALKVFVASVDNRLLPGAVTLEHCSSSKERWVFVAGPRGSRLGVVSVSGGEESQELVVADDGSIPAEQISRLGLRPGTHLRVVPEPLAPTGSIAGRLTSWPDLAWEDFERASRLAQADAGRP